MEGATEFLAAVERFDEADKAAFQATVKAFPVGLPIQWLSWPPSAGNVRRGKVVRVEGDRWQNVTVIAICDRHKNACYIMPGQFLKPEEYRS